MGHQMGLFLFSVIVKTIFICGIFQGGISGNFEWAIIFGSSQTSCKACLIRIPNEGMVLGFVSYRFS